MFLVEPETPVKKLYFEELGREYVAEGLVEVIQKLTEVHTNI